MAYDPNEQVVDGDSSGSQKRVEAYTIMPKTFAPGTGTLEPLTPVAYHTGLAKWVVFDGGGSSGETDISGFVWPDAVELVAGLDVLGQVLIRGKIHADDVVLPDNGTTQDQLNDAMRTDCRALGIDVQGLSKVR